MGRWNARTWLAAIVLQVVFAGCRNAPIEPSSDSEAVAESSGVSDTAAESELNERLASATWHAVLDEHGRRWLHLDETRFMRHEMLGDNAQERLWPDGDDDVGYVELSDDLAAQFARPESVLLIGPDGACVPGLGSTFWVEHTRTCDPAGFVGVALTGCDGDVAPVAVGLDSAPSSGFADLRWLSLHRRDRQPWLHGPDADAPWLEAFRSSAINFAGPRNQANTASRYVVADSARQDRGVVWRTVYAAVRTGTPAGEESTPCDAPRREYVQFGRWDEESFRKLLGAEVTDVVLFASGTPAVLLFSGGGMHEVYLNDGFGFQRVVYGVHREDNEECGRWNSNPARYDDHCGL